MSCRVVLLVYVQSVLVSVCTHPWTFCSTISQRAYFPAYLRFKIIVSKRAVRWAGAEMLPQSPRPLHATPSRPFHLGLSAL